MGSPVRQERIVGGRPIRFNVAVTADEAAVLLRLADRHGVTVQRFLVQAGLGVSGAVMPVSDVALLDELRQVGMICQDTRRQLVGVATNLNQLAHWANTYHSLPDEVAGLVEGEIRPLVERLGVAISEAGRLARACVLTVEGSDD